MKKTKNNQISPPMAREQASVRTDLAVEEQELWRQEAGTTTKIPGVEAHEVRRRGILTTKVHILDEHGEKELHKPVGKYVTLELEELNRKKLRAFHRVTETLAGELAELMQLPQKASVLVVGLGNEAVTPDAIGPATVKKLLVTRHLIGSLPESFGQFRSVSALCPGVLGTTGLESAQIVRAVVEKTHPDCLVVVDALAARTPERLCCTVQLSDAGIIPGSGVGNSRSAFTRQVFKVPVYAIGVPTVADAGAIMGEAVREHCGGMIVTPRDIDARVGEIAAVISCALNIALHNNLTREEIAQFVE